MEPVWHAELNFEIDINNFQSIAEDNHNYVIFLEMMDSLDSDIYIRHYYVADRELKMTKSFVIKPRECVGPFKLGMTREEIWAQDRSPIMSYFPQSHSKVRSDDITLLGIHVHYDEESETANHISVFTKVRNNNVIDFILFDERINDFQRQDVEALLELNEVSSELENSSIRCTELGLVFGFLDDDDIEWSIQQLDYVNVLQ